MVTNLHDRITRLRAAIVSDGYGNGKRDWTAVSSADFLVHWSAKSVAEVVNDEPQTITRAKIFGGPDLDLEVTDRVLFNGDTYEVDGDIMRSYRRGNLHHVRAMLLRIVTTGG
jgi:hypothetical protein